MSSDFESTPYDGHHPLLDPGNDWRGGNGIADIGKRIVSYGNFAGPDNRFGSDPADQAHIKAEQAKNPHYDPYLDQKLMSEPHNQPIDGIDAAAREHDHGYFLHQKGANMFGWEGMRNVREDDRQLAARTQAEMDQNGSKYSAGAQAYSQGLRGYFGGRVKAMDAVDWVGNKAGEVGHGISDFVHGAKDWHSAGDAARGVGTGISNAFNWTKNTVGEGVSGLVRNGMEVAKLGPIGWAGAGLGALNVAGAGLLHAGGKAWDGAKSLGSSIAGGVSHAASAAGTAISNGAGAVVNGAKAVGSSIASGVSTAASAVGSGAKAVGGAIASGASSAASAVGSGAKAVGGAIAGGASKAWNWLTHR